MKRKTTAILIILLLITIPIGIVEASQTSTKNNETVTVRLKSVTSEGIFDTETFLLTENEIIGLEEVFSNFIEEAQLTKNLNGLRELVGNILGSNKPMGYILSKSILKFKSSHSRAFVISFGRYYDFNPFKQNDFKIRKPITIWHYSSNTLLKGRTLIIRPFAPMSSKILNGRQFGVMTKFTGLYINIIRTFPDQSYTFFIGVAKHANGIELPFSR
ncbi:MAG: hypothetical protein JSW62_01805 [Thermoplasmatales archaeon]|nr:MAG: hypothetical protein JSW62_01805 [Thermoplasmatales archaeon]